MVRKTCSNIGAKFYVTFSVIWVFFTVYFFIENVYLEIIICLVAYMNIRSHNESK